MQISSKEELLLMAWQKRDREALSEILDLFGRPLYSFLCCLAGRQGPDMQNLLIEVLAEVLREPEANKPFLVQAFHTIIHGHPQKISQTASPSDLSLKGIEKWQLREQLAVIEALQRLPWEDRALILLRDQQELLLEEIKDVLGWPEERIKKQLREARLQFREKVEEIFRDKRKAAK